MKLFIKLVAIFLVVCVLLYGAVYVFFALQGKASIKKLVEDLTQKKLTMGKFSLLPPLNVEIKNISVENLLKADSVFVAPSLIGLLTGRIVFNEITIVRPEFSYSKSSLPSGEPQPSQPAVAAKKQATPMRVFIKRLKIKDGNINFTDKDISKEGLAIRVSHLNFDLENLYSFPASIISEFELSAAVAGREGSSEGKAHMIGWINFFKKDMKATLKIEDIDGVYFYPYYSQWVDLEKAHIENAKLDFTSDIQGVNDEVTANCRLELAEIKFKERGPDEKQEKAEKIAHMVLDIFKSMNNNKIVLDFTIKTKINSPIINFSAMKIALEDKISQARESQGVKVEDVARAPGKMIGGTVEGLADITRAFISGGASIGKELKSAIEGAFTKEPVPQPQPESQPQAQPAVQTQPLAQEQTLPQAVQPAQSQPVTQEQIQPQATTPQEQK